MHVSVEKGAKEGDTFKAYIEHLASAGYITPPMRPWVEKIKDNGNHSTHKIIPPSQERAMSTVMFTAELLRLTYEMEFMTGQYVK